MIQRIWRGWTTPENAPLYEGLLRTEIFPRIAARGVDGYRGIRLLRREVPPEASEDGEAEVEFVTLMSFETLAAVEAFAGEDREAAYVPEDARAVLKRFDARSRHYEVVEEESYGQG